MGKFGIRDRGEARSTDTFDQLEKVNTSSHSSRPSSSSSSSSSSSGGAWWSW